MTVFVYQVWIKWKRISYKIKVPQWLHHRRQAVLASGSEVRGSVGGLFTPGPSDPLTGVCVRVCVCVCRGVPMVTVETRDAGPGVPPESIRRRGPLFTAPPRHAGPSAGVGGQAYR